MKKLLISMSLFLSQHSACVDGSQILLYSGPGASKECLRHTHHTLSAIVGSNYSISEIGPEALIDQAWEETTALLVMPGGADLPYCEALNGAGNQKIAAFVAKGGSYLGICAGSYYAGNFVEFAKGTDIEVTGLRELSFFQGMVRGPLFGPYDYLTNSSSRAAPISWQSDDAFDCTLFYNGGGYFVDAWNSPATTVLATYNQPDYPAIVECSYGAGRAILSGIHFEFDSELLDPDDCHYAQLIPALKASNQKRLLLVSHLLERLLHSELEPMNSGS